MAGGFGGPSFGGVYGATLGRSTNGQGPQSGGPDYGISPMAGGTAETPASSADSSDVVKWGLLGEPLSWWLIVLGLLIAMSILGARR